MLRLLSSKQLTAASRVFARLNSTVPHKIHVSVPNKAVRVLRLNRPAQLNAINQPLIMELAELLAEYERKTTVRAVIITGDQRAFAAGADIKEMASHDFSSAYDSDFIKAWSCVSNFSKPIIAAVNGYALGGGCELAMMCDIILAGKEAKFGQPEISIGTIPGAGGTQRLTRAVGKSRAMELIMTGRMFDAYEAQEYGLVSKIYPVDTLLEEAIKLATTISKKSPLAIKAAKQAINGAYENTLSAGTLLERNLFYGLFSSEERRELMEEFVQKANKKAAAKEAAAKEAEASQDKEVKEVKE